MSNIDEYQNLLYNKGKRRGILKMIIFKFDYEIPPLRAVYSHGVGAKDKESAISKFKANNPRARILKVEIHKPKEG